MLTDAHYHPSDLFSVYPEFEHLSFAKEPGILAAASSCNFNEFTHNEMLSRDIINNSSSALFLCFGIHPQQFSINIEQKTNFSYLLEYLDTLASEKRIAAVGEIGFDLYNSAFRETEAAQESIFTAQLEIALKYDLPVVLHVRRAIHKIFNYAKLLSKCRAVIFHSWSNTFEEAETLLRRRVNAYFSFGNTVMLNHKQSMRGCILLPAERLLTETDAPYQPRRGQAFSQWEDLPLILETMAALRMEAGNNTTVKELENQIEANFRKVFYI